MNRRNVIITIISVLILTCLFAFARTTTTDLGLVKPTWTEDVDILTDINANSDLLEAFANDVLEFDLSPVLRANLDISTFNIEGVDATELGYLDGVSSFGGTLIDDADASTARTTLGLVIGTNVEAHDDGLLSIAGLTTAANRSIYTTALDVYAVYDLTSFARTILDDADASAVRTTIDALQDVANAIDSNHYTDASIDHEHLAPDVISGLADVTSTDADYILIWDNTDSALKKCDMAEVRGAGETNTASNVGTALAGEVFKQKVGVDLEFRKIEAGSTQIDVSWYTEGSYVLKENYSGASDYERYPYGTGWEAQTFLTTSAYAVKKISLWVKKVGTPADDLDISIRAVDGNGKPTGADLISGSILASAMDTSYAWLDCVFSTFYDLTDATNYAIVMSSPNSADSSNCPYVGAKDSDVYGGGSRVLSTDSGSTWTVQTSRDFLFKSYAIGVTYKDQIEIDVNEGNIKLDDLGTPDDNTDLNASTSVHGLLKKLPDSSTQFLDGTGAWVAYIATEIRLVTSDADPDTTGEIKHDSTVAGFLGGALRWYDNDSARIVVDLETDPVDGDDDKVVAWDSAADGWYMKADADSGGATAWDDITNPDANDEIDFAAYVIELNVENFQIGDGGANFVDFNGTPLVTFQGNADIDLPDNSVDSGDINFNFATSSSEGGEATTFNVTDNESEALACPIIFVDGAIGSQGAESDDTDFTYNPSTGTVTATAFVGALTGNVTGDVSGSSGSCTGNASTCTTASAGDAAVDFFGAGVDAVTDATICTDIEGTLLSIATGTLNAAIPADHITYDMMQDTTDTDKVLGRSTAGGGTVEEIACTSFARSILDDADEATFKATVNLEIGTDVEVDLSNEAGLYAVLSDVTLFLEDTIDDTSPELGGELDAGAHSIGFTLQTATGDGTTTIDWRLGNKFKFTFGAQNDTLTFTAPTNPGNFMLWMIQDGTGSRTMTWPTIYWPDGTVPTLSTAANAIDIVGLAYDGTSWFGVANNAFATP